eukprot:6821420-Lingulodinium_polyedra.AAC.1
MSGSSTCCFLGPWWGSLKNFPSDLIGHHFAQTAGVASECTLAPWKLQPGNTPNFPDRPLGNS